MGFRYRTTESRKQPIYQTKYIVAGAFIGILNELVTRNAVTKTFYTNIKENKHSINEVRRNLKC